MFEGNIKVQSYSSIIYDKETCDNAATEMEKTLMSTRPTPESSAKAYCFEVPTKI
tara:strand:- start:1325 stop:1489 length:165 start_codon:yes stop_codon:yes gene_type:complete